MTEYISVRNWRRFQHYDPAKRAPLWIKNYVELTKDDDYLTLSSHLRGVLHGIWMEYASARCHLTLNTASLSRRLALRVMRRDIESLVQAGWLAIVDSAEIAEGYQEARAAIASRAPAHSLEEEGEKEGEGETSSIPVRNGNMDRGSSRFKIPTSISEALRDAS
jgi:hypothetical protein